jgi:hypothetical protein
MIRRSFGGKRVVPCKGHSGEKPRNREFMNPIDSLSYLVQLLNRNWACNYPDIVIDVGYCLAQRGLILVLATKSGWVSKQLVDLGV